MAWVEDISKRDRKRKEYRDPDLPGKVMQVLTIHDQHYHDGVAWQDVDETLTDDGLDGYAKRCDKTRHIFRVANGGQRRWYPRRDVLTEYVNITNIQFWRTTGGGSWRNLNLPAAVWKSDGAEWDLANLYASITNNWHRIKTEFILKDSTAPTRLRFAVEFVGLDYNPTTGELTSTTDGQVWGYINSPFAWYGNAARIRGTPLPVTATYDGTYIEWSVNTSGATFPVYIDPTWTDGYGGDATTYKDSIIDQGATSTNYGGDGTIYTGNYSGAGTTNRVVIQFDVSSIPGTPTLDTVTFSLYVTGDYAGYARTIRVFRLKRTWVEAQVTWASYSTGNNWQTAGAFGSDDCEQTDIGSRAFSESEANGYKDFTLTPTSKANLDLGYGWLVKADTENLDMYEYASSDAAQTDQRPKLVVVYTESGVTKSLTDTGAGTDQTPQLSVSLSQPDIGSGVDNPQLAASLNIADGALGGDFLDLSAALSLIESGIGADTLTQLLASLGINEVSSGNELLSLLASLSTSDTGTGSDEVVLSVVIVGSTVWGHVTGVQETNIRTFAANWTGTGQAEGSGDDEKLRLCEGDYMISEIVETGIIETTLLQNNYASGDTVLLQYRTGATEADCLSAGWNTYTVPFESLGYVQVRVEYSL